MQLKCISYIFVGVENLRRCGGGDDDAVGCTSQTPCVQLRPGIYG